MNIQKFKHLVAVEMIFAGALEEVATRVESGEDLGAACIAVAKLNPVITLADLHVRATLLARASKRSEA